MDYTIPTSSGKQEPAATPLAPVGYELVGTLPAGTKVIDICTTPFGVFLATEQGVYRFNDKHNEFEPVELGAGPLPLPSFDDWFKDRNGMTFDEAHLQPGSGLSDAMQALTRGVRDYSTWVAQELVKRGRP